MVKNKPTEEQFKKLPAWAKDYLKKLEHERSAAVRALNKFQDEQTKSSIFVQDFSCTGETGSGPVQKKKYIQEKRVYFELPRTTVEGFELEVFLNESDQRVEIRTPRGYPYIEPHGNNLFYLMPREIDLHPNAKTVLRAMTEADALSHDDFVARYGFSQSAIPQMVDLIVGKKK